MGRRLCAAAVSGAMRHEALTYGRAAAARPAGDGVGAAEEGRSGLTEGRILARRLTERRSLRLPRRAECAFPSRRRPGGVGRNPPPACGALWRVAQLGKCARGTPRQAAGGLRRGPQASAWGPTARKGAVWAEGLADGAPWARPGHHQAASCGLRRCQELRVMSPARVSLPKGSMGIPSSCLAARQQDIGCSEC